MSLLVYIIICVLVIVLIILLTFAIYYNKLAYECSTYPLSWCNNWYCRLGSDETVNNKMIAAGIVPVGSQPGYEYSVTNDVYIPALTKCTYNTTDLLWFDTTTKIPCNPTNNPKIIFLFILTRYTLSFLLFARPFSLESPRLKNNRFTIKHL